MPWWFAWLCNLWMGDAAKNQKQLTIPNSLTVENLPDDNTKKKMDSGQCCEQSLYKQTHFKTCLINYTQWLKDPHCVSSNSLIVTFPPSPNKCSMTSVKSIAFNMGPASPQQMHLPI